MLFRQWWATPMAAALLALVVAVLPLLARRLGWRGGAG